MKVKLLTAAVTIIISFFVITVPVEAQSTLCDVFPCNDAANPDITIGGVFTFLTQLIFVGFIGFGIVLIIKGALKITRSEGDEGKIQEGTQAIRGAMIGLGMIILGIIGLVILTAFLNTSGVFGTEVEEPEGVEIDNLL
jgi:hypothetical protein